MLDVVAGAAKAKGLNNINTRQGYAESLPFDDASLSGDQPLFRAPFPQAHVLDLGCGAGHASFTAAQRVAHVTAYDLSARCWTSLPGRQKRKG